MSSQPFNEAEWILEKQCEADGIEIVREYRFDAKRRYRLDIAVPERKVGLEIEGGLFSKGAHSRPVGIIRDMAKGNLLVFLGWKVLRYTPLQVRQGDAIAGLKQLLKCDLVLNQGDR
jgi:very-short-patch-repair endonuclease